MDYDATDIAVAYDRGRDHGPEVLTLWMNVVSSHVKDQSIRTILDLGCGTGRFSEALAVRFDAEVVGLDPSKKMLEQARRKQRDPRIRYELGRGEGIPLPNNSVAPRFKGITYSSCRQQKCSACSKRCVTSWCKKSMIRPWAIETREAFGLKTISQLLCSVYSP